MISAIYDRRSIRKYIVIQGKSKEEMQKVFRQGIEREENESALLPLRNKVNQYGKTGIYYTGRTGKT